MIAEAAGFSFWDPAGEDGGQRRLRNADTVEFMGGALCTSLWARLAPFVPPRVEVREGQPRQPNVPLHAGLAAVTSAAGY